MIYFQQWRNMKELNPKIEERKKLLKNELSRIKKALIKHAYRYKGHKVALYGPADGTI